MTNSKLKNSDKSFIMQSALLECMVANNLRSENLVIRYNKEKDEYRIVNLLTNKIMFKKIFN